MFQKNKRLEDPDLLKTYHLKPCIICNRLPSDPAHIKTVKSGGPDAAWNLLPFCRKHHSMQHAQGFIKMFDLYPHLFKIMESMGWRVQRDKFGSRLVNVLFKV